MKRQFPLAGLLRLRRLEQDQAAAQLGSVNARLTALNTRREEVRRDVESTGSEVDTTASLRALAAARGSSMSMLTDLRILALDAETDRRQARSELKLAAARTMGLEKLEERHAAEVTASELAAEQGVLDELASASWQRNNFEEQGNNLEEQTG